MKARLRRFTKRLHEVSRSLGRRQMREEINHYFVTGEEPQSDVARAYVAMLRAFNDMADASCGGDGYEDAEAAYRDACQRYESLAREVAV